MSGAASTARTDEKQQGHERSVAEWVTFGVATLLLAVVIGLVIYEWITIPSTPPLLAVRRVGQTQLVEDQYRVQFEITNSGGETVSTVQVIAEVRRDGGVATVGEQQIDFLSPGESEQGAFLFSEDPDRAGLKLRVAGYTLP